MNGPSINLNAFQDSIYEIKKRNKVFKNVNLLLYHFKIQQFWVTVYCVLTSTSSKYRGVCLRAMYTRYLSPWRVYIRDLHDAYDHWLTPWRSVASSNRILSRIESKNVEPGGGLWIMTVIASEFLIAVYTRLVITEMFFAWLISVFLSDGTRRFDRIRACACLDVKVSLLAIKAVSYTHLDVYKRQL